MKKTGLVVMMGGIVILLGFSLNLAIASVQTAQTALPGKNIPKYVEPLPTFAGIRASGASLTVSMEEFQQQVLPASFYATLSAPFNAGTYVWGYNVNSAGPSYPARTVEAQRGSPTTVTYINNLVGPGGSPPVLQKYLTVDQTIHWADPLNLMCMFMTTADQIAAGCFQPFTGPVPAVVHLHGAEVPSFFDGVPEQWFTPNGLHGFAYASLFPVPLNEAVYQYPNTQDATTLWFHDHALGSTRLNVYSGLAGFYLLRDSRDTGLPANDIGLPGGANEIEFLIQDRQFDTNGQLLFPDGAPSGFNGPPTNPDIHPFWSPEFFGDVIVVNGKSWPFLQRRAAPVSFPDPERLQCQDDRPRDPRHLENTEGWPYDLADRYRRGLPRRARSDRPAEPALFGAGRAGRCHRGFLRLCGTRRSSWTTMPRPRSPRAPRLIRRLSGRSCSSA